MSKISDQKNFELAIKKINEAGILLVYPIKNKDHPSSLWSSIYPRSKMNWSWDGDADSRVAKIWLLMKSLSDCGEVIYTKWYKNRATFISKRLFLNLLAYSNQNRKQIKLSPVANEIYDSLLSDSPLSTKALKKIIGLVGRDFNSEYEKAMRELYKNFFIVSFGEVNDGAFPSNAVGATQLLFEDLWLESQTIDLVKAKNYIDKFFPEGSDLKTFLDKTFKIK